MLGDAALVAVLGASSVRFMYDGYLRRMLGKRQRLHEGGVAAADDHGWAAAQQRAVAAGAVAQAAAFEAIFAGQAELAWAGAAGDDDGLGRQVAVAGGDEPFGRQSALT